MRFSLSTHLFHGERLARHHLEAVRDAGFMEVEVFATKSHVDYHDPGLVREVREWLDDLGLRAGSMHGPICESFAAGRWGRSYSIASTDGARRREGVDETGAALEAARILGAACIVVHLGLPDGQPLLPGDNDARALARSLDELSPMAARAGVGLAFELIPNALSTVEALLDLADADANRAHGLCLDTGHAHMIGGVADAVEALGGAIVTTHVHDNNGREDSHLVPFQGTVDWPAALAAFWKVGYTGSLVFEVADRHDPAGVLRRTVDARHRLQAILDDLASPLAFAEDS